jgi:hypothetical protein
MSNLAQRPHERTAHPGISTVETTDSHHRRRRQRQQAAAMAGLSFLPVVPAPWFLADFHATQSCTEGEAAREHQPQIATLPHGRATLTAS